MISAINAPITEIAKNGAITNIKRNNKNRPNQLHFISENISKENATQNMYINTSIINSNGDIIKSNF